MAGRHGFWKFTAARARSIRKAQAIRAARMRGKSKPTRSADTLGKYARSGMKKTADVLTVGVAGKWSGMVEPKPGGRTKWYLKDYSRKKKPPQKKRR